MASTCESKKDGRCGGRRHGPPTEEERQQRQAEFKQEFLDEYRQRHGDALISAEQTWQLYQTVKERRHAKKKERRHSPSPPPQHDDQSSSPPRQGGPPPNFEEKRKQFLAELEQDFQQDFTNTHGANQINGDQAWSLIQNVQRKKHEKWEAHRQTHGHRHGRGDHEHRSPPADQ